MAEDGFLDGERPIEVGWASDSSILTADVETRLVQILVQSGTPADRRPHTRCRARGHLLNRVNQRLDHPGSVPDVQRFAKHLAVQFPALFTFLFDPIAIEATNWRAEQALRPAVVTRKVSGGNRSCCGAATQQILASVLRTAHQRRLDAHSLIVSMLRARHHTVPREFQERVNLSR